MSQITTHILDTSTGKPAAGIEIVLEEQSSGWKKIAEGKTNQDGRISDLISKDAILNPGIYRMIFSVKDYFSASGTKSFYPKVSIEFEITDSSHYHIPLLISPYGYSTYRGS